MLFALADLIKRRLRNENMTMLNERLHIAIEEGQKKRTDMGTIDIGIGHDDDLAITALREIEILADARAKCRDHRADLGIGENFVKTCLLNVQDLAAQRQDGLETAVAALLGRTACRITLDDVDLSLFRILDRTVGKLARQAADLKCILAARKLARLACCLTRTGSHDGLLDNLLRDRRILLEILRKPLRHDRVYDTADFRVAELRLRLAFELRLMDFQADDARKTLTHILTREVAVIGLQDALLAREIIGRTRERDLEAGQMRAALFCVDIIDEAVDVLCIAVVVLHGNLDDILILRAIEIDWLRVDDFLFAVQMLHEGTDTALIEIRITASIALIRKRDRNALIQEGQFAQTMLERIEIVRRHREDLRIWCKMHARTRFFRLTDNLQRTLRHTAGERNLMDLAIALDLHFHGCAQRVDDGDTDAMQAAGYLIAIAAELAAGMQYRQNDLNGRLAAFMHIDRNATAIINNRDAVILLDGYIDMAAITSQGLID